MLIISAIGLAAMRFAGGYYKHTYERDRQISTVIANIDIAERIKAEVRTLPQLYAFARDNPIRIIKIGSGEITLTDENGYIQCIAVSNENYGFSEKLKVEGKLFRIEVGGELPNTKIITIIRLEDSAGD